jgi:uncharacterized protein YnzC (UPF0291/DUF896 family)
MCIGLNLLQMGYGGGPLCTISRIFELYSRCKFSLLTDRQLDPQNGLRSKELIKNFRMPFL